MHVTTILLDNLTCITVIFAVFIQLDRKLMDIPENPRWYPELDGNFVLFSLKSSSGEDTNSNGVLTLISVVLDLSFWLTLL